MTRPTPLVEQCARYTATLGYEQIPAEARQIAKWLVFDTLGTGLGGYQRPLGIKAADFAATEMAGERATILGDGRTASVEGAAFANATMIKILGMDDSHRVASHIAAQVIPAALASAEANGTGGRELIAAIVAAYDLAVRVGRAVRGAQRQRGLDVKGTVGAMAAALAAGRCAGLGTEQLAHALALAADMSSGTEQYVYDRDQCDTKDLISGFAARNGVFAARLAARGFFGPRGALDGEYGFFRAFGPGSYNPDDFADLGEHFAITSTAFKPHGGCRHTHQAVDAVQQILRQVQPDPADIARVVVHTYSYALQPSFRIDPNPPTREVAGLSIRVATAVTLVRHSAWPNDFSAWDEPEVRRLRQLIEVEIDPEIERAYPAKNGCRVLVVLHSGEQYEGAVEYARGEPESRMTEAELRAKFAALTRQVLAADVADDIFERSMKLEAVRDMRAFLRLASVPVLRDDRYAAARPH